MNNEEKRIKKVYQRYKLSRYSNRWDPSNPGNRWIVNKRNEKIKGLLEFQESLPLGDKKILDVGCGTGSILRYFTELGSSQRTLYGIDLLWERTKKARGVTPDIHFICGNAERLPFRDETFDIVSQFTVFTSILDGDVRKKMAFEMLRVLRKNGLIIWYDFRYSNPVNLNVRGIGKKGIAKLFPNCNLNFSLLTLYPLLARRLAKYSIGLCEMLSKIPLLRTHYLVAIKKSCKR